MLPAFLLPLRWHYPTTLSLNSITQLVLAAAVISVMEQEEESLNTQVNFKRFINTSNRNRFGLVWKRWIGKVQVPDRSLLFVHKSGDEESNESRSPASSHSDSAAEQVPNAPEVSQRAINRMYSLYKHEKIYFAKISAVRSSAACWKAPKAAWKENTKNVSPQFFRLFSSSPIHRGWKRR